MTTSAPHPQNTSQARPQTDIDRLAEAWVATEIELSPERRVELGVDGDKSEYGDYSSAAAPASAPP